jgi:hypothetical protein
VPWKSSGWNNDRNVAMMLEMLVLRGEVAATGQRRGRDRLWDLAQRIYPADPAVPVEQALRLRNELRLRALGIARASGQECPVEPLDVGEAGEPAVVEGVKGGGASTLRCWASRSAVARRCCHRSIALSMTASGWSSSSSSTTNWRCSSPLPNDVGGTSRCRSCTGTGWWARSTPSPTTRPGCCGLRLPALAARTWLIRARHGSGDRVGNAVLTCGRLRVRLSRRDGAGVGGRRHGRPAA